jgi:hypothetical protein
MMLDHFPIPIPSLIISLTAAVLLSTSASAEVIRPDDGPPGFYSVGPWEGRCIRDGWLEGSDHESCGAEMLGASIDLYLARTVKGLTVTVNNGDCKNGVFKAQMTNKLLALPNRAKRLEGVLNSLLKKQTKKCGTEGDTAAPITTDDLTDILNETDGLEF